MTDRLSLKSPLYGLGLHVLSSVQLCVSLRTSSIGDDELGADSHKVTITRTTAATSTMAFAIACLFDQIVMYTMQKTFNVDFATCCLFSCASVFIYPTNPRILATAYGLVGIWLAELWNHFQWKLSIIKL